MDRKQRATSFLVIVIVGTIAIWTTPNSQLTRDGLLNLLEAIFQALGVVGLILLWAQLRHTATLNKLIAYHRYFHDLPSAEKFRALYEALDRLKLKVPIWQEPFKAPELRIILSDTAPYPKAEDVVRDYLNDFQEFAAAVNSGFVDDDYAYHIESARPINAYYGFRAVIEHWLVEDQSRAVLEGGVVPGWALDAAWYTLGIVIGKRARQASAA
ncbi:MAG TPA: hypothetical protein VGG63_06435 [Steroidobacteraceae bacterium]